MTAQLFTLVVFVGFAVMAVFCLWLRRKAVRQDPRLYRPEDVSYYTFATGLMATTAVLFAAIFIWGPP